MKNLLRFDWRYFVLGFGMYAPFSAGRCFQQGMYGWMGVHVLLAYACVVFFLVTEED